MLRLVCRNYRRAKGAAVNVDLQQKIDQILRTYGTEWADRSGDDERLAEPLEPHASEATVAGLRERENGRSTY